MLLLLFAVSFFFSLGLWPQIHCREPSIEGMTYFMANLDNLGGSRNPPDLGRWAASHQGWSGREVGLGRAAHECHLQDCPFLLAEVTMSRLGAATTGQSMLTIHCGQIICVLPQLLLWPRVLWATSLR